MEAEGAEGPRGDLAELREAWMNEKSAPEILQCASPAARPAALPHSPCPGSGRSWLPASWSSQAHRRVLSGAALLELAH